MNSRPLIHIPPQARQIAPLFSLLEGVMPVRFSDQDRTQEKPDGELKSLDARPESAPEGEDQEVSPLRVPLLEAMDGSVNGDPVSLEVHFSRDPEVPFPFRGRTLKTTVMRRPIPFRPADGETVLASCASGPLWAYSEKRNVRHFRSGLSLPRLVSGQGRLLEVLNGHRFLEMIPLLHWLRRLGEGGLALTEPPVRASFIFDDPNLHWPKYGYVDYRQLAAQAEKLNYHLSFAAIPLDAWFTHRGTAAIFSEHKARLSLLIHGNNHTNRELAQPGTNADRVVMLKEAISRIERMERQSGLEVSRVMVPPHGACSEEMLMALPVCTFEAICVSHKGLTAYNKDKPWVKTLGYLPFELVWGCRVFPRWPLSAGEQENTVLLAAYLKQAIVLYGHHQDLKDGSGILDRAAGYINSLGVPVEWSNLNDIVRASNKENSRQVREALEGNDLIPRPSFGHRGATQVLRSAKRRTFSTTVAPFVRRFLTEGRDRLKAGGH